MNPTDTCILKEKQKKSTSASHGCKAGAAVPVIFHETYFFIIGLYTRKVTSIIRPRGQTKPNTNLPVPIYRLISDTLPNMDAATDSPPVRDTKSATAQTAVVLPEL